MAIEEVKMRIKGTTALLMHSTRGMNLLDPDAKELHDLNGKRKKTDEDQLRILYLDWLLGLYWDKATGPYLPSWSLQMCLSEGGKKIRQGIAVLEAVLGFDQDLVRLEYDGPRDIKGLYGDPAARFVDIRPVGIGDKKVNRARPQFVDWSAAFSVLFDAERINRGDLLRIADLAGRYAGVGDYRPRFGRFSVEEVAS